MRKLLTISTVFAAILGGTQVSAVETNLSPPKVGNPGAQFDFSGKTHVEDQSCKIVYKCPAEGKCEEVLECTALE